MSTLPVPVPGSVSWGTLRTCDLVPAFLEVLESCAPAVHAKVLAEFPAVVYAMQVGENGEWWDTEEASILLNECLFDALEEIAPAGCYFGAHEGDGSDFGYWSCESDDASE